MRSSTTPPLASSQLSQELIPSVPGEFYSYSATFTFELPLYPLLKCKANKTWGPEDLPGIAAELDLVFCFGDSPQVCSPNSDQAAGLLRGFVTRDALNQTFIIRVNMAEHEFERIRTARNGRNLADFCEEVVNYRNSVDQLEQGAVYAVVTTSGKYGLIRITNLTPNSASIDACHTLL